ncbi:MAG: hypothetical protein AAFO02_21230 [Bacteroidota bacterium]
MRLIYLFVVVLLFQFSLIGQNTERLTETLQFPREQAEVRNKGEYSIDTNLCLLSFPFSLTSLNGLVGRYL